MSSIVVLASSVLGAWGPPGPECSRRRSGSAGSRGGGDVGLVGRVRLATPVQVAVGAAAGRPRPSRSSDRERARPSSSSCSRGPRARSSMSPRGRSCNERPPRRACARVRPPGSALLLGLAVGSGSAPILVDAVRRPRGVRLAGAHLLVFGPSPALAPRGRPRAVLAGPQGSSCSASSTSSGRWPQPELEQLVAATVSRGDGGGGRRDPRRGVGDRFYVVSGPAAGRHGGSTLATLGPGSTTSARSPCSATSPGRPPWSPGDGAARPSTGSVPAGRDRVPPRRTGARHRGRPAARRARRLTPITERHPRREPARRPAEDRVEPLSPNEAPSAPRPGPSPSRLAPRARDADPTIRWRDVDAYQHVNNAVYLNYLEEAATAGPERARGRVRVRRARRDRLPPRAVARRRGGPRHVPGHRVRHVVGPDRGAVLARDGVVAAESASVVVKQDEARGGRCRSPRRNAPRSTGRSPPTPLG